jgi:hypothetical protein
LYFTAALVDEVSETESTLDDRPLASGVDESEVIAAVNCEPFSSSSMRLLFGVEELKNVFQLVVISETALDEPPPAAGLELAAGADAEDDAGVLGAVEAAEDEEELELLLEQADIAVTSTRPSAGAR